MSAPKIEPCGFCGGKCFLDGYGDSYVVCDKCNAHGPQLLGEGMDHVARARWNRAMRGLRLLREIAGCSTLHEAGHRFLVALIPEDKWAEIRDWAREGEA